MSSYSPSSYDDEAGNADDSRSLDGVVAAWMSGILLLSLLPWVVFRETAAKYIIYSVPFTLTVAYLVINRLHLRLHMPSVWALTLYMPLALVAMVANSWYSFLAVRDLAIISGYLMLFTLWFRAPAWTADFAMLSLGLGMIVEGFAGGVAAQVSLTSSTGILESTLAFPLGLVTLFYFHNRQWGRALIATVLLFIAFKRIAFVGVAAALVFNVVTLMVLRERWTRLIAVALVVVLSLVSLFSIQIFEAVAEYLDWEQTNANSLSLGRYEIARQIWNALEMSSVLQWTIGAGPGAADAIVTGFGNLVNPHNDWLKIFFDYGAVGFVVIHLILYWTVAQNRLGLMLYIYGTIVMMTDNIFIYIFYHPFVMLMISAARTPAESDMPVSRGASVYREQRQ